MSPTRRHGGGAVFALLGASGLFVVWGVSDPTAGRLSPPPGVVLSSVLAVGLVVAGVWMAATDYESASDGDQAELEREREKLDHLNRLLRHHLLNGMNVLLAKVDHARNHADDPQVVTELDDARVRGEEIVTLVEQLSAITAPDDQPGEVDLARLLRGEVEQVRASRGDGAVALTEPLPEVTVRASPALGEAVRVLLKDALRVSGRVTVSATLDADDVVVNVATPEEPATDGGDQRLGAPGSDVGLSIADVLVERAGGELETGGTGCSAQIRLETA
ncbi:MAG: hypothetical protein ABEJ05_06890 [Haloglomus sp.]